MNETVGGVRRGKMGGGGIDEREEVLWRSAVWVGRVGRWHVQGEGREACLCFRDVIVGDCVSEAFPSGHALQV